MSDILLEGTAEGERLTLAGAGAWTAENARRLEAQIDAATKRGGAIKRVDIDMGRVERLDTFGAWLLERLTRSFSARGCATTVTGLKEDYRALVDEVHGVKPEQAPAHRRGDRSPPRSPRSAQSIAAVGGSFAAIRQHAGRAGRSRSRASLAHPRRFRFTSMVHQLDNVGWRAVPIILLITFLIGCIIAQQGIFHFRKFGADIYVVDMVGILVLRELGVLIVCIMVAGRSGCAYTAELGSMKMREEIDALRTMGFDPIEVLILPRILALIIGVPILTFLGSLAALYGGGLVCWLYGGIDPDIFLPRLKEAIALDDLRGRHDQGAVHGAGDRRGGLRRRHGGEGLVGIARAADHRLGGGIDLPGDRARRLVRHLLRLDRDVSDGARKAKGNGGRDVVIEVRDVVVGFGDHIVLDKVDLDVYRGEILGFVGGSGAGKSVLMRTIIGLLPKRAGTIKVFGVDLGGGDRRRAAGGRAALGRAVPAGRAVFLADGAGKPAIPDPRISQSVATAARRTGGRQARNGRARRQRAATNSPPNCRAA